MQTYNSYIISYSTEFISLSKTWLKCNLHQKSHCAQSSLDSYVHATWYCTPMKHPLPPLITVESYTNVMLFCEDFQVCNEHIFFLFFFCFYQLPGLNCEMSVRCPRVVYSLSESKVKALIHSSCLPVVKNCWYLNSLIKQYIVRYAFFLTC